MKQTQKPQRMKTRIPDSKLPEMLKRLRLDHRISLREVEEKTGISYATLSRFERGIGEPADVTVYHVRKFIEAQKRAA